MVSTPRNHPCPCGSGKKYKHCCAQGLTQAHPSAAEQILIRHETGQLLTIPQILGHAVQLHQAGRLRKAEAIYQQILQHQPSHADAQHLLGLICHQKGQNEQAYTLITQAISTNPDAASFHNNLGEVCRAMNRLDEAYVCYHKALELQPDFPEVHRNIGLTYLVKQQPDKAVSYLRNALVLHPNFLGIYWALGQALMRMHQAEEAVTAYDQGLALSPSNPTLLCSKGVALEAARGLDVAIEHYLKAIDLQPSVHDLHMNLALCYQEQGRIPDAIARLQRVIELQPQAEIAKHMLAALQKITPDRAPASYVRKIFDDYADHFDKHLVDKLEYHTPALIAEIVQNHTPAEFKTLSILDLGCGTGLFGEEIKRIKKQLVGVDLSPRIIDKARERSIYDQLIVGDLLEYLSGTQASQFDLVAATDVFNYVGNLLPVFEQVSRVLVPGGGFTFSIEAASPDTDDDFILDKTGRYQHHKHYLERLGGQFGFAQTHFSEAVLRQEHGQPVSGYIFLFKKPHCQMPPPTPHTRNNQ